MLLAIFGIAIGEFFLDILTPLGVSDWVCYFIPLLMSAFVGSRFFPYLLAGLLSVLILLGFHFSPPGINPHYALTARVIGFAVFWVMALLLSRRREIEDALQMKTRALKTITDCNQTLMRAKSEPELLREICRLIVEQGGYCLAWVGFPENDAAKSVRVGGFAGCDEGYLTSLELTWADTERGRGPAGTVLRTGQIVVSPDVQNDPVFKPWQAQARERGFAGMTALPLKTEGKVFGVLCIYATAVNAFHGEELDLLKELAGDLAFGIQTLRSRLEHQQAEEQLRKLGRAVEQSPASIIVTDLAGRIEYVNPKFVEISGYAFEEVRGKTPRILKADGASDQVFRRLWQTISAGHEWRGEFLNRKKNGETFWEAASVSPITDANGRTTGYVAVKEDITRDKLTEEKIREQAALLNLAHDAITTRDMDERITYWNKGAERIYGWTQTEAMGQAIQKLLCVDPFKADQARQSLMERGYWMGEHAVRAKAGNKVLVESSWTLVRDAEGRPKSVLAFSQDITHRRRLEQQLARAQRIESLGTLASGIAHDLNNILTPIMVSIALLKEQTTDPAFARLIESLDAGTQRGARLVKQILTFGRGVSGERIPLNLGKTAREIQQFVAETFPKSVQLEMVVTEKLWSVVGDPTQIHQVLLNLAINARDAMPGGGVLTFQIENHHLDEASTQLNPGSRPGPHVLIRVADTGEGMTKEVIERIFDPFYTTKSADRGTGLGLSTSLGIIKSHGGCINVYSEPGRGTTFKIYLPAKTDHETASNAETQPNNLPYGRNELVLLVDDEPAICAVVKRILENHGYRVKTAAHGAEAISIYAAQPDEIAVVITDMNMPIMDGPTTIIALKTINPRVKIIGSSGLAANGGVAKAASAGVRHFVPKPFTAEKMLRTLHEILDDSGSEDFSPNL